MNQLLRNAAIVNVVLLVVFIWLDAVTWNDAALNLDSRVRIIWASDAKVVDTYAFYTIVQVGITASYVLTGYYGIYERSGSSINLPLVWFVVTIVLNLFLIWHSETKRLGERTEGSKTKSISPAVRVASARMHSGFNDVNP